MQSARRRAGAAIPARPRDQPRNRAAGPSPIPPGPARGSARHRASSVPEQPHKRSRYELGAVAVVTLRRVAGGLRRAITSTATLMFAGIGGLLLVFPRVMAMVLAAGAFSLALAFGLYTFERRRTRDADDG